MLSDLAAQVRSSQLRQDAAGLAAFVSALARKPEDIAVELEIAFRHEGCSLNLNSENELLEMMKLIKTSISFVEKAHELAPSVSRIPLLLISDALERVTISVAERVWRFVEELAADGASGALFARGKFIVLKLCNALLRRLSKSCNTEFCGRILMFLAAMYPLSERSAVNISGKANMANTTSFEELKEFETFTSAFSGQEGESGTMDVDESVDEGGRLLALARARFAAGPGETGSGAVTTDTKESITVPIDFDLYKSFWGIQNFLSGDAPKISSVGLTDFAKSFDRVLSAFESNSFTDSELEQAQHSWEQMQNSSRNLKFSNGIDSYSTSAVKAISQKSDAGYSGCKYLTSSQLFALQLKDPLIREQILTQMLFHLQYLKLCSTGASEADKTLASVSAMESRVHAALNKTPPNGAAFLKTLTCLLDREQHWISWKKKGCVPFEKSPSGEEAVTDAGASTVVAENGAPPSKKRKRAADGPSGGKASEAAATDSFVFRIDDSALQITLNNISKKIPSFEAHIESFVEAEDPDAGIEEAYHPKNDPVYCWRARRLLANKKLAVFEDMADGDISKGLKKMNKLQNPSGGDKGPTADRPATQAAALAEDSKQGEPVDIAAVQSEAVVEDTRQDEVSESKQAQLMDTTS